MNGPNIRMLFRGTHGFRGLKSLIDYAKGQNLSTVCCLRFVLLSNDWNHVLTYTYTD